MATQDITVTRDTEDPTLFHVKGRRVSGRVRASISFETKARYERADGEPEERILVNVSMNRYRPTKDDPEVITVNGVGLDGYSAVQINDPWRPNVSRDGYLHKIGGNWNENPSSAAYQAWFAVADQVADLFGTDEAIHAARIAKASDAVDRAETELYEAQGNMDRAVEHLATLRRTGPRAITRPAV